MSIVGALAKSFLGPLARAAPPWLLRRRFSEPRLAVMTEVDFRSTNPITVNRTASPATISVYVRATNHLPFDVSIEAATAEIWLGQPWETTTIVHPVNLQSHSTSQLFFTDTLDDAQTTRFDTFMSGERTVDMCPSG